MICIYNDVGIVTNIACCNQDKNEASCSLEECIKQSLNKSYENCMTFPWIKSKQEQNLLRIHRWYFNLQTGTISAFSNGEYSQLPE